MRCRLTFFTMLIVMVIGFACQSPSSNSKLEDIAQVVRINIRDEPQTLDPRKARNVNSLAIVHMLFDGLTRANKEGKVELSIAERVDVSPDLKKYTFYLKNAVWTNGDRVVASDFAYAWKKMLSPDFPSDTVFLLYVLKNAKAAKEGKVNIEQIGVHAVNEKTLVVELENPAPYFLELVGSAAFFPVNQRVDEKNPNWAQDSSSYVGNGPFQLVLWKHQDQLEVKKNEKYWDASHVKITALKLQMLNEETELRMFEKKQLDWAGSPLSTLPLDALKFLKENHQLKIKRGLATCFVRTNTESMPFNHPSIRKAFALAVNRKSIVEHVAQGNQMPATGLVPLSFGLQKEPYFQDADLENAKQLFTEGLTALHLTKEELPEIRYLYRMSERNHLIAQALQQQWYETLGIRVRLEGQEAKVFFNRVSKQDYQLAYGDWIADFADPINFLEVFKYKRGGSNNTLWENPEYARLLDLSSKTGDPLKRYELMAKSEQILMNEMPVIPILYSNMLYLTQEGLRDVVFSSLGIDFKWASIVKENKKAIAKGN